MSFVEARWLWLLLAIPLLWLFALRRGGRREIVVSSILLWKQAADAPSERPRPSRPPPSLWFWSLFVAAAAAALARPYLRGEGAADLVVFFENSARMGTAVEGGGTRFSKLKEKLDALLAGLPSGAGVRLAVFPGGPEGRFASASEARNSLASLRPTETPCDLEEEVARRVSWIRDPSCAAALLCSDRIPKLLPAGLSCLAVGSPSRNVGFVSLGEDSRNGGGQLAVVKNFSSETRSSIVVSESSEDGIALNLAPGESRSVPCGAAGREIWTLRLEPSDELPADDRIFFVAGRSEFLVEIPAAASPFLRLAFQAIPGVRAIEPVGEIRGASPPDLRVALGPSRGSDPAVPTLHFDPGGPAYRPRELRSSTGSALGKLLDFDGVRIERAHVLDGSGGTALAWARDEGGEERPLIVREGERIRIGFDLAQSDWHLHPSFPVFLAAWVEDLRAKSGYGFVRTGRRVFSAFRTLVGPDGEAFETGASWIPLRTGIYRADGRPLVAANLLDAGQSENGGETREVEGPLLPPSALERRIPLGGYFLALALISFAAASILERKGR